MSDSIIVLETIANQQDIAAVGAMLNDYNSEQGLVFNPQSLAVFIRNNESGRVIAGLKGSTHWEWLRIKLLAVHKSARNKGLGTQLLNAAEKEALQRGCKFAFVDTYSFQALPFYKKCGYEVFGELPEYPTGHSRIFLRKTLTSEKTIDE
jgi:GNAT superfamily N-acetyltransferase